MRRLSFYLGTALIVLGALLVLGAGALSARGVYERAQFEREQALTPTIAMPPEAQPVLTETPIPAEPMASATLVPTPFASPVAVTTNETPATSVTPWTTPSDPVRPTPSSTAASTRTPRPGILPAKRIIVPKVQLDSRVVESPIVDGQWEVPKFVAGHLVGTANPGVPGNVALAGHVESISSGNVFAYIDRLVPGDLVVLVTDGATYRYVMAEQKIVAYNDLSVIGATSDETLTLITCTGSWIPALRDFDKRIAVVLKRAPADFGTATPAPTATTTPAPTATPGR